jgi:tetratricopeptide (TPR) repeat protein
MRKAERPKSQQAKRGAGTLHGFSFWLFGCLAVWLCNSAVADSITFTGSSIPLKDCRIQAVQGGTVHYFDSRGQRQRRELDTITALGFDGLPQLDQAERALDQRRLDAAFIAFLTAMTGAKSDLQRMWVHVRLSNLHAQRKEYVQAMGHAAAVLAGDDAYWLRLDPRATPPEQTAFAAVTEALENVQLARRKVAGVEIKIALDRMLAQLQPLHDRLAKTYSGPPLASGGTISGIGIADIPTLAAELANDEKKTEIAEPAHDGAQPQAAPRATSLSDELSPALTGPDSPQAVDSLLGMGRWSDALESCRRIEQDPGERDLAHFLFQYGSALAKSGNMADAATMFSRCFVLFPDTIDAPHSLIQTAIIYRDEFKRSDVADRLLQRAVNLAEANDHASAAMLARELMTSD